MKIIIIIVMFYILLYYISFYFSFIVSLLLSILLASFICDIISSYYFLLPFPRALLAFLGLPPHPSNRDIQISEPNRTEEFPKSPEPKRSESNRFLPVISLYYMYMYVCMCIHIYAHIYIHIYIYIYI